MGRVYLAGPGRLVASHKEFEDYYGGRTSGDGEVLRKAVAATPDSTMGALITEPDPQPTPASTDVYEYAFALTRPNIEALWRSGFEWDNESMKTAIDCLLGTSSPR